MLTIYGNTPCPFGAIGLFLCFFLFFFSPSLPCLASFPKLELRCNKISLDPKSLVQFSHHNNTYIVLYTCTHLPAWALTYTYYLLLVQPGFGFSFPSRSYSPTWTTPHVPLPISYVTSRANSHDRLLPFMAMFPPDYPSFADDAK